MQPRQLSLKGRALRLLGMREHSRAELERKLASHEQEPGELQRVLDDLQAKDFISDERAAESVLHRRSGRLGAGRIRQELQAKGIAAELVAASLASLKATELERAREVWRKKFGEPPQDAAQRAKQARLLVSRGISGEVVARVQRLDD